MASYTELSPLTKSAYTRLKEKYRKNNCGNYFRRFDKFIMRPIFIYKYNERATKRNDEFMNFFIKDADIIDCCRDKGRGKIKTSKGVL
jgi:hypothetical protein